MVKIFLFATVLIYFTNVHLYFSSIGANLIRSLFLFNSLYFYIFSISFGLAILIFGNKQTAYFTSRNRAVTIWSSLFIGMSAMSFVLVSPGDDIAIESFIQILKSISFLVLFVYLGSNRDILRIAIFAIFVGTIISVFMNYVDYFNMLGSSWRFSFVDGRAAGFFVNPNISGQQLAFGMVLSVFIIQKEYRWWFCIFVATGILLTFSRGAILLWVIAVLGIAWCNGFVLPRKLSVTTIGAGIIILVITLAAGTWVKAFQSTGINLNENASARIGGLFLEQNDYSSKTRKYVAEMGVAMLLNSPIIGYGVGATFQRNTGISPHNMYLYVGIQYGIIGVILFLSLIWIIWSGESSQAKIIATLYAIGGLFSHNNLELPTVIIILALAVHSFDYTETPIREAKFRITH